MAVDLTTWDEFIDRLYENHKQINSDKTRDGVERWLVSYERMAEGDRFAYVVDISFNDNLRKLDPESYQHLEFSDRWFASRDDCSVYFDSLDDALMFKLVAVAKDYD